MNKDLHARALELQRERVEREKIYVKVCTKHNLDISLKTSKENLQTEQYILQTLEKLSDE